MAVGCWCHRFVPMTCNKAAIYQSPPLQWRVRHGAAYAAANVSVMTWVVSCPSAHLRTYYSSQAERWSILTIWYSASGMVYRVGVVGTGGGHGGVACVRNVYIWGRAENGKHVAGPVGGFVGKQ
eukprot:356232-Chlamydomonas_euryale.AAC.26